MKAPEVAARVFWRSGRAAMMVAVPLKPLECVSVAVTVWLPVVATT